MHREPAELYIPVPQLLQLPPICEYPALHLQSAALALPAGECESFRHDTHASVVISRLTPYVPAAHALHPPVATPQNPALHVQSVSLVLAGGALEFAGHF